ncbi:MAG: DNA polymerase III subunit gamma/tau [Chloroherpetonaceae bacterium]|nr:DNA polymerase III subunit gamma/tau [Chloroherpetonaceae bacterium]
MESRTSERGYTVIARKYRPMKFADISAQDHITRTLQNAIRTGRIAHGYIFSGSRGVGKTTSARILAKALNCEKVLTDEHYRKEIAEPCGVCESCRDFDSGESLNIFEFDAASNNSVDDVRSLRDNIRYGPQKGKYRVYIIDEFHMLSAAAFNALLKTLEEPPPHAIFIFATTELHKVPPTISSRCQRFIFKRIAAIDIAQRLRHICDVEGIRADEDALQLISRKADGAMRDAQSLLDQVIAFFSAEEDGDSFNIDYKRVSELLNTIGEEQLFSVTDAITEKDAQKMLEVSQFIYENGYDASYFLDELVRHIRNLMIIKNVRSSRLIDGTEQTKKRYESSAQNFTADILTQFAEVLAKTSQEIRQLREPQLRLELSLLRLIDIHSSGSLDARLQEVEKGLAAIQELIKKKNSSKTG